MDILFVEDDADDRLIMEEAFRGIESPVTISFLDDGEKLITHLEALERLPGLIVLDMNMPRQNGIQTLELLKQHPAFEKIPVVMFSTSGNEIDINDSIGKGALQYLIKPATYEESMVVARSFFAMLS